ncbi:MAG: biopolymer transporter ExbD [Gallionellales bacterium RIFCSPLOWO2_12_FULL_59_22]|nr:MAG: biopolymer transporter ExbD [Gallionellales bacterium RIFCSPLOWO2_02_FULL_59_110]OGT03650.1 MAG: biopolymer transporter ExbD [Gallionellales bacterium RIFCSPLOWO2_02_58_13]OGT11332.1 MAG: biopolymer transporter ExbD [Gallionellales bacterium RIFCSPLOWO2_12_FULL_59_22]
MAFQNNSNQEMMSEINVTPLVDVMLVLLVVFIVTAPLLSQSLEVKLPRTAAVAGRMDTKLQTVTINAQGAISLESISISDADLAKQLAEAAAGKDNYELHVHADETVPYGRVAQIMAIAQHAGVSKLSFMTMAGQ